MNNKILGDIGESIAVEYLKRKGYLILEEKYKMKIGEIDIIAREKSTLVFIEVKTRRSLAFGYPSQAVNYSKQHKIIQTAQCYLRQECAYHKLCRFDVIEIYYMNENQYEVNHIKNAFETN